MAGDEFAIFPLWDDMSDALRQARVPKIVRPSVAIPCGENIQCWQKTS
jgi:hypothetical protein